MISFRKISAASKGKLIRAYLSEGTALDDAGRRLALYYAGRDPRASWRPDMAPAVAQALGINPALAPGDEALERLFEARRGDTGEAWTANKRSISAYDFTASPHKSVTLAIEFARDDAEKAAIMQAVWRANDEAMRAIADKMGWARRGDGGKNGAEPGEVGWASFMHFTARPTLAVQDGPDGQTYVVDVPVPGDPQTHIHNAMFNPVVIADGHIGSLETAEMQEQVHRFGAIFQGRLADELKALGIRVRYNKGDTAAVVEAIPEFACEAYSKGHKATVRKAKDYARRHGLDWDALPAERKLALLGTTAQNTRLEKFDGKSDRALWRELAERIGWRHTTAITGEAAPALTREEVIDQAAKFTIRHVEEEFATAAVLNLSVVQTWAARGLIGNGLPGIGLSREDAIDAVMREVEQRGVTLHGEQARLIIGEIAAPTLVGGDYDRVVDRIAGFYLERRDALRAAGSKRGVTASALTNADAAEISRAIRVRLKARGEVSADEAIYAAIDNRGEQYELPVATGDRFRLYKKTSATIDGRRGFIGANRDVVEVARRAEDGLVLRDKNGRVGHVQWRRLRDRDTGRLLLGYGHCLTVDSAQGITSGEHINALPRGSAGITAFKGYVAESRHEVVAWTMVGEWAEREAERTSRPLGDGREITEADLWARTARNMAAKPYKSLGIDLADKLRREEDAAHDRFIRSDLRIQRQQAEGCDHAAEFAAWQQDRAIRRTLEPRIGALDLAIRRNGEAIEGFRAAVADSLRELGRRMEQALRMLEQQVRRARLAVPAPAPQPPVLPATPDQSRPDAPATPAPPVHPSGSFRM